MARPPLLAELSNARTTPEQIAALRSLKDDIIGHDQRKEKCVEEGLLHSVVDILRNAQSPSKLNGKEPRSHGLATRNLSDVELVRLQALQIVASIANGGPPFLAPVFSADTIPVVLSYLSPLDNPPQVSLTVLRILNNLADAAYLTSSETNYANLLADTLFVSRNLETINSLLTLDSTHRTVQEQKVQVASLISKLCKKPHHQNALANAGILDALASLLASFVAARGEVVPDAEKLAHNDGLGDWIPPSAPAGLKRAVILEALSTVIQDSRFRACMLLCSPSIMATFPNAEFSTPAKDAKNAWSTLERIGLNNPRYKNPGAMDYLLPVVVESQPKGLASRFLTELPQAIGSTDLSRKKTPVPSSSNPFLFWTTNRADPGSPYPDEIDDAESPLIPWLVHFIRSSEPLERVLASSILASLFKARFAAPEREVAIAALVVPVLCRLIEQHDREPESADLAFIEPEMALDWAILERAPAVLARLVADSESLQQTAAECGIIKVACKLLKDTYTPLPEASAPRHWSPAPAQGRHGGGEGRSTSLIGEPGQLPIYAHRIKVRESSLKLIAAMCSFKQEYQKAFADEEIVPYIVESLSPCPKKPSQGSDKPQAPKAPEALPSQPRQHSEYGDNPNSVIIAACHVVRTLGRSLSVTRTSLKDHGVATPIFSLLKQSDVDVQIAACAVVCNMVTETSPMREELIEGGILKVLCEHAHSLNPGLRLNAMWSLKHLVYTLDNGLKKRALEELESGWLIQLICDDTEDQALHERMIKSGRRMSVDGDDVDMDGDSSYEDGGRPWVWPAMHRAVRNGQSTGQRLQSVRAQKAEKKLAAVRESELNPTRKARNDDLAIQEQGLDFIRNITVPCFGAGSSMLDSSDSNDVSEMIDFVFNELGQDRLFDILQAKLRPKILHPFERRYASSGRNDSKVLYPQAKVVEAAIYILVHISASVPRHRQLVISQTELLKSLGTHFTSNSIEVRRALCRLLRNLVSIDDPSDTQACHQRALELKKLGFQAKMESMEHDDVELDIRELAKGASWVMQKAHV